MATPTRVAVLGSNSFSGSHFVEHVLAHTDAEVLGISRSPEPEPLFLAYREQRDPGARFRFLQADLNHAMEEALDALHAFKPQLIVNYAAQGEVRTSWSAPEQWFATNAMAVVRLTQGLADVDWLDRYVAISTPEVYGSTGEGLVEAPSLYAPSTPYAASKAAGDMFLIALQKAGRLPVTWVRSANVYGPHQQLFRIIPKTALNLLDGQVLPLHNRGRTRRAFLHIQDACACTLLAATVGDAGEIWHQSPDDEVITIGDLVRRICARMGKRFEDATELVDENFGQDATYSLSSAKARTQLGWAPMVTLDEGIDQTLSWIERHRDKLLLLPREYQHKP
jgi:dTDP-glucose 4,6-dehydratase